MGVNGFGVVVGDLIYFNGGVGILSGGGLMYVSGVKAKA